MIELAIKEFLADPSSGDTSQADRQAARTELRGLVGLRMTLGRRPQGQTGPAMTIRRVSTINRFNDLPGEDGMVTAVVDCNFWTKADSVPIGTIITMGEDLLRRAITQYRGAMGDLYIHGCTIERDGMGLPTTPADGSDNWSFVYSMGLSITYAQTPVEALS